MPVSTMPKSFNQYRREHYMSVTDFARFLGISVHTFYSIVQGKRVTYVTIHRVAKKLGVHPSEITEFAIDTEEKP